MRAGARTPAEPRLADFGEIDVSRRRRSMRAGARTPAEHGTHRAPTRPVTGHGRSMRAGARTPAEHRLSDTKRPGRISSSVVQ